ncbi:hypothetical protein LSH36_995g01080 [Paralvinella palmiformis]|uniref:Hexosyltransferase n=1 Tax=Paralvinella palmiformis TaxID=53620 RepID=A0AAD9IXX6_9ANNE|nr:hypothetical protein LSH36_995g01080 [Paralvinella palmiformis]
MTAWKKYWRHLTLGYVIAYSFIAAVLLTIFLNVVILLQHPERAIQLIDYFNLPPLYLSTNFLCSDVCNEFPQQHVIQPSDSCPDDLYLLFLIVSSYSNRLRRDAIRQTWGSMKHYKNKTIRAVFILGIPSFTNAAIAYTTENRQQRDLLIFNITDSYANLTNKTVLAFQWVSKFCASARFVLKTDDDSFNVPQAFIDLTENVHAEQDLLLGQCASGIRPYRDSNNKWFVSERDYSDQYFPLYLRGRGYLLTQSAISKLLLTAQFVRFNPMEDVFWTGLCRLKANLAATCSSGFAITEEGTMANQCQVASHDLVNIHHATRGEMLTYWSWINAKRRPRSCQNITWWQSGFMKYFLAALLTILITTTSPAPTWSTSIVEQPSIKSPCSTILANSCATAVVELSYF